MFKLRSKCICKQFLSPSSNLYTFFLVQRCVKTESLEKAIKTTVVKKNNNTNYKTSILSIVLR